MTSRLIIKVFRQNQWRRIQSIWFDPTLKRSKGDFLCKADAAASARSAIDTWRDYHLFQGCPFAVIEGMS